MEREGAGLAALRQELRDSYPAVDTAALAGIIRRAGWNRLPAGLLAGDAPASPRKLAAALRRARHDGGDPLFSADFYSAVNPDVRAARAPAWLHYQAFGRLEGRSPHPLIDPEFLGAAIELPAADAVDAYLERAQFWAIDPGPYVEVRAFLLSGRWDRATHPLPQIVTRFADGPWIHRRLMTIDAGSADLANSRLAAVGALLSGRGALAARVAVWTGGAGPSDRELATDGPVFVVPGSFVGYDGRVVWSRDDAIVPDRVLVRTPFEVVTLASARPVRGDSLTVLTGDATRAELEHIVESCEDSLVLAPACYAQEISLRQLRRDRARRRIVVLEHGRAASVRVPRVRIADPDAIPVPAVWDGNDAPRDVAVVLPDADRRRANTDPEIRKLLRDGAALCLVDHHGLNAWLPIIQSRSRVIAAAGLVPAVAAFIDADRIRRVPA